jgi:hypothetical protein
LLNLKDADGVKITVGTSKKMGSSLCKLKANLNDRSVFFSSRGKFLDRYTLKYFTFIKYNIDLP